MSKDELIEKIIRARRDLLAVLEAVPPEQRETPGACGEWSVKDVLVNINYWEGATVTMLYQLRQGLAPDTLHFDPNLDVEATNQRWHTLGKERPWEVAWADFNGIHTQMLRRVKAFSESELNDPGLHAKLSGKPLWRFIEADSYGHEDEHAAALRAWLEKG